MAAISLTFQSAKTKLKPPDKADSRQLLATKSQWAAKEIETNSINFDQFVRLSISLGIGRAKMKTLEMDDLDNPFGKQNC